MDVLTIDPGDRASCEEFLSVTDRVPHAADWVQPLRATSLRDITGSGAFGRYGRMRLFVARARGQAVARLAAIVNPRLVDAAGAPLGQIGWFESTTEDVGPLFAAAFDWLHDAGSTQVIGPINGGAHLAHRFMTSGFDRPAFLLEPRNPSEYPRLFEAQGFSPVRRWRSYDISRPQMGALLEALSAPARRAARRFRLDPGVPRDIARTLDRIHPLLDVVWAGHAGYAHLDRDELGEVLAGLLALMTERHLLFAVDDAGRDVGLAFIFPDYVDQIRALRGDASGWGAWLPAAAPPGGVVLHTIAVAPEVQRTGLAHLMMEEMIRHAYDDGHSHGVVALVDEDFRFFGRVVPATRDYALYGRLLG